MNMRKPITAIITAAALLMASIIVALPREVSANHYQAFPGGTNSNLDRPTFGYVTTTTEFGIHGDPNPSPSSDIDQSRKLDESLVNLILYVNGASSPTTPTGFTNALTTAINSWEDPSGDFTEQPFWTVVNDNSVNASLFGPQCAQNPPQPYEPNNKFEAAFCTLFGPFNAEVWFSPSHDAMAANGGDVAYTEADMAFNINNPLNDPNWTDPDIQKVARHELGHFFGLGDLYTIHDFCGIAESVYGPPVMCDEDRPVSTGDINGLYYLYPQRETLSVTGTYDVEEETDLAIAELTGNNQPEFVVLQVNEELAPSPDEQHFVVKPFLDMNKDSYNENAGVQEELFPRSVNSIDDVGLSIVNIGGGSSGPDMIISWIEFDTAFWKVYWDISLTGSEDLQWSSESNIHTMPSLLSSTAGIDTIFMDMDEDPALEMVVIKARFNGADYVMDYSFVELDDSTGAASESWNHFTTTGAILEDDDIGAAVIDDDNRLVAVTYNAESTMSAPEYAAYKVVRFDAAGAIDIVGGEKQVSRRQLMPLEPTEPSGVVVVDGFGADAYNWTGVGASGPQYKDLVVLWLEDGITDFVVDRDARYNAHGGSTNDNTGMVGVYAQDCIGEEIIGMSVSLYDSANNLIQSGFTPMYVDITTTDSYQLRYNNFGSNIFVSAGPAPPVMGYNQQSWGGVVSVDLSATAILDVRGTYNTFGGSSCDPSSITIRAERNDTGAQIDGLYVQLQNSGHVEIDNGFTTVTFSGLAPGTYYVYPNDFSPYFFSHWEDTLSTDREREVILGGGQSPTYTAVYDYVP